MPKKTSSKKATEKVVEETNAHIPPSVLKQGKAADDLQTKVADGEDPEKLAAEEAAKKAEREAKAKAEAEAAAKAEAEAKAQAEADAAAEATPDKPVIPADEPVIADFEHKYKVLKGKYDSEVPALTAEVKALKAEMDKSKLLIQSLQDVADAQSQAHANLTQGKTGVSEAPLLDPDKFKGYGEEIVDLVNVTNQLRQENADLKAGSPNQAGATVDDGLSKRVESIEATQHQSAEKTFNEGLDGEVPGWKSLNRDKDFIAWLNESDKMSGFKRLDLIRNAAQRFDVATTAEIFKAYATEKGLEFKGSTQSSGIQDETKVSEDETLHKQVMPERTVGSTGEGQPKEEYATKAEFVKAQRDFIGGRITEPQFKEIADSYQTAIAKGVAREQ
jgi:hypothetical protein